MAEEEIKSCEQCGATIYPEHIESNKASFWAGHLLCPACLAEKKSETVSEQVVQTEGEPLTLVDDEEMDQTGQRRAIKALGAGGVGAQGAFDDTQLARSLNITGQGATRVRVFHSKMNDGAAAFMTQTINGWIDAHPDVEIKSVHTTVGVWEGKHPEPHLILTICY